MYRLTHLDSELRNEVQREIDVNRINKKQDSLVNNDKRHSANDKNNNKKQKRRKEKNEISIEGKKSFNEYNINAEKYIYSNDNFNKGTVIDKRE